MPSLEYVAPTKRKKIGKKEAAKLFLLHNGICCNCGRQIGTHEDWFIEHVDALILGGAESDDNRRPAHVACKAKKDAEDAAARSKRDEIITKNWQRDPGAGPQRGSLPGKRIKYSRARGVHIDRLTGEVVNPDEVS